MPNRYPAPPRGMETAADSAAAPATWFEALLLCVVSADFYVEILRRWRGTGLLFLGWLLLLLCIPLAMKVHHEQGEMIRRSREALLPQFPTVTVKDGVATTDVPQPHVIYAEGPEDKTNPMMVVDTTGTVTSLKGRKESVLITSNAMYFKVAEPDVIMRLPFVGQQTLGPDNLGRISRATEAMVGWVAYPFMVVGRWMACGFQALLLAALASFMLLGRRLGVSFQDLFRLSVMACIPAIYLDTIASLIGIKWLLWEMVLAMVTVIYVTTALRAIAEQQLREEQEGAS